MVDSSTMSVPRLVVRDIKKSFGAVTVLRGVNFEARAGEPAYPPEEAEGFVAVEEAVKVGILRQETDPAARLEAVG